MPTEPEHVRRAREFAQARRRGASPSSNGRAKRGPAANGHGERAPAVRFANYFEPRPEEEGGTRTKVGLSASAIRRQLVELSGGWPKRVGKLIFVEGDDGQPLWLDGSDALFAWIGSQLASEAQNRLRWACGEDKVTQAQFFAHLQQHAERYEAVEPFPHWPALPGHYYLHAKPKGGDGRALRELLGRFSPLTDADYDLIHAFFLSLLWGGRPGQRPAWLVTTDDQDDRQKGRGSGKSTLAKVAGRLVCGLIQASAKEEMSKLITRLLTPSARPVRVVLLDNIKTLKFSWAELEAIITADVISGHQMYAGEGQRPNTLTWCLTINGASLSRDMAQRAVPIMVKRAAYTARWEDETFSLVDAKRWEIIGDCLAQLRQPGSDLPRYTRWGAWEAGILSRVAEPAECQKVIAERQGDMDDDANEEAVVREAFVAELQRHGHRPDEAAVWFSATEAAEIVNKATGERYPTNRASVYLNTLSIPELRKSDHGEARGWAWRGAKCPLSATLTTLATPPSWD